MSYTDSYDIETDFMLQGNKHRCLRYSERKRKNHHP